MMVFRSQFCAIALLAGLGLACDHTAAAAKGTCAAFAAIDPDNDGTLDLNEANQAAAALLDELSRRRGGHPLRCGVAGAFMEKRACGRRSGYGQKP